jgi:1-acyl-sn-glycerol-3-phosphate acyltransferase
MFKLKIVPNWLCTVLLYFGIALSVAIWIPPLLLLVVFPLRIRFAWTYWWSRLVRGLCYYLCGIEVKAVGLEQVNLPTVFLCKHQSALETLIFFSYFPQTCFIFKKELLYIPGFGWGLWAINQIGINRSQALKAFKQVVKKGKQRLGMGISVLLFPEGTRTKVGEHPPFHKSGAALAKMAGASVIPVAVNSGHCWPRHTFIKKPGRVILAFGPRIDTTAKSVDEITTSAYSWIKQTMQQLNDY